MPFVKRSEWSSVHSTRQASWILPPIDAGPFSYLELADKWSTGVRHHRQSSQEAYASESTFADNSTATVANSLIFAFPYPLPPFSTTGPSAPTFSPGASIDHFVNAPSTSLHAFATATSDSTSTSRQDF